MFRDFFSLQKCPFGALSIVNLPSNLEKETTHRYCANSFKLHRYGDKPPVCLPSLHSWAVFPLTCYKNLEKQVGIKFQRSCYSWIAPLVLITSTMCYDSNFSYYWLIDSFQFLFGGSTDSQPGGCTSGQVWFCSTVQHGLLLEHLAGSEEKQVVLFTQIKESPCDFTTPWRWNQKWRSLFWFPGGDLGSVKGDRAPRDDLNSKQKFTSTQVCNPVSVLTWCPLGGSWTPQLRTCYCS